jgi:hypothetical protein
MSITEESQPKTPGWTADASTFSARLSLIRNHMGWGNIAKAAKECGVAADSWRNWEVDGREPHRLVTIAVAIATRTGCDLDWLVYGPNHHGAGLNIRYRSGQRVIAAIRPPEVVEPAPTALLRPVPRTRPIVGGSPRPLSPATL